MNNDSTFGDWLRRCRRGLDLTQRELAQRVGCGVTTIRKIEASERRPSKELAAQLAISLGIPSEEQDLFISFARAEPKSLLPPSPSPVPQIKGLQTVLEISKSAPGFLTPESDTEKTTPVFVARERELAELNTALTTARSGKGQILFIIGGAGRGKTMLIQEFARRAMEADSELCVVSGYCNVHFGAGDPYLPFREALNILAGDVTAKWAAGLFPSAHARRLWELMPLAIPALVNMAPDLIGSFIQAEPLLERAVTFAPHDALWFKQLKTMTTQHSIFGLEQKRILNQYTTLLKTIATLRPLLIILEDLQWLDTSSNDLLFYLSREIGRSRILIIGSYRPDEAGLNRGEGHHPLAKMIGEIKRWHGDIWLDMGNLGLAEGQRFVSAYIDSHPNRLGSDFREALFRQTEGHPLFTVELVREMQERGDLRQDAGGYWVEGEGTNWTKLPARVEGVIETRINRLRDELRTLLTVASVEGEIFIAEVVARVQHLEERAVVQQLSQELVKQYRLVTPQALDRVGEQRLSYYRFRHHLFQHYLYIHLDEMERSYLHEAVGKAIESLYGEKTEQVAVQLAHHFELAGLKEKAVSYLFQGGKRARRLSAYEEAIGHLSRGIKLLGRLPKTPEQIQLELEFQIALGNSLVATKGHASPEVGQTYLRAWELCQHVDVGDLTRLFPVLHGLHRYHLNRAELPMARELGEQMLNLAERQQDPLLLVPAERAIGATFSYMGEFALARAHLERGLAHYDSEHHTTYVLLYGQDEGVACLAHLGRVCWFLGYPEKAVQRNQEAITLAQKVAHPFSLAYALNFAAWTHRFRQESQEVQDLVNVAISLSTEHGFATWLALSMVHQGWALTRQIPSLIKKGFVQGQEQGEEGIVITVRGLANYKALKAELLLHYLLGLLAEAHANMGHIKEGLAVTEEALAASPKTGRFWEAELYRQKGELLLREAGGTSHGKPTIEVRAEHSFRQAIEVARQQEARSLELRAAVSLGRLLNSQGKREEARKMVAGIYEWFSEGFETLDLQIAREFLGE